MLQAKGGNGGMGGASGTCRVIRTVEHNLACGIESRGVIRWCR